MVERPVLDDGVVLVRVDLGRADVRGLDAQRRVDIVEADDGRLSCVTGARRLEVVDVERVVRLVVGRIVRVRVELLSVLHALVAAARVGLEVRRCGRGGARGAGARCRRQRRLR